MLLGIGMCGAHACQCSAIDNVDISGLYVTIG